METVSIPVALFESPNYRRLSHANRDLLLNLYYFFGKEETFSMHEDALKFLGFYTKRTHFPRFKRLRENDFLQAARKSIPGPNGELMEYQLTYRAA